MIVSGVPASILIDLGATDSFVEKLGVPLECLDRWLSVSIPSGVILNSSCKFKGCKILVDERKVLVDLVLLNIHNFDIILIMDWSSVNHATIDCNKKKMMFQPPQQTSFSFLGIRNLSR